MKWVLSAVLVCALVAFGWWLRADHKTDAEVRVQLATLAETRDSLKARADSLEKVYHVDTVRVTRTVKAVDTLTQTVETWKHDTVKVVEYVAKADTAIKACAQALATCDERVGVQRARAETAEARAKLLEAHLPSKWAPTIHRAQGGGVVLLLWLLTK